MQDKGVLKKTRTKVNLKDTIIDAILDKKGEDVVSLDLKNIDEAVTDHFIICHATSSTQIKAIAESILSKVEETSGERPWHKEGFENLEWVLIDYVDVVVHIFQKEKRAFYQLEDLWSDAAKEEHT